MQIPPPALSEESRSRGRVRTYTTRENRGRRCIECGCGLAGKQRHACGKPECQRVLRRTTKQMRTARTRKTPKAVPASPQRQCPHCLARADEVIFETVVVCSACYQNIMRFGRCGVCADPMHTDGCYRCAPPPFNIEILWQSQDGRLRKLYRRIRNGMVSVANHSYLVRTNPLTLVVPVEKWLLLRS